MGMLAPRPGGNGIRLTRRDALILAAAGAVGPHAAGAAGELVYGVHISLAPTWFDPAETPSLITPYMVAFEARTSHPRR
jgi:peptide/nickel transport system substrate-binding protein